MFAASVSERGNDIVLENGSIAVAIDKTRGAVTSIRGAAELSPGPGSLFTLTFLDGAKTLTLESAQASCAAAMVKSDPSVRLTFEFSEPQIKVICTAGVSQKDTLVRWHISAAFPEPYILTEVRYPVIALASPMGSSLDDDRFIAASPKGGVRMTASLPTNGRWEFQQPGTLAAQFGYCYDDAGGIYIAAYDGAGYPKQLELRRPDHAELSFKHLCHAQHEYSLPYDVVTSAIASSDWRAAADVYKEWALSQPWCATTYAKRTDIPAWMKAGAASVQFDCTMGGPSNRPWLATPERIEQWVMNYWKRNFPADVPLIVGIWGWEKVAPWVGGGDYFPVFPSNDRFALLVSNLRANGCHVEMRPSGYNWSLTYQKLPDGMFYYDGREYFNAHIRPHAIHELNGDLRVRTPSWLKGGDVASVCPGEAWTQHWWNNDVCAPLARLGVEIIEVDQNVGGRFAFCYANGHAHPSGPGKWMTDVFSKQLRSMQSTIRTIEPGVVVGFEEPNELFNGIAGIQDYRDCEFPNEWASVFNYLYHEYLPTFQASAGNNIVWMAHGFADGQMPRIGPSSRSLTGDTPTNHTLLSRWVELYHGEGRPYLLFGRMLRKPPMSCAQITAAKRTVPALMHNAFRSPDGSEAVIIVNASEEKQSGVLTWKGKERRIELERGGAELIR